MIQKSPQKETVGHALSPRSECGHVQGLFPIILPCNEKGWSDLDYQSYFLAAKPDELIWYGYDTIIQSQVDVEFVVYDMHDSCYGGRGKRIASFKVEVPRTATTKDVDRKIMQLAAERRAKELHDAEMVIINSYADEIRAALLSTDANASPNSGFLQASLNQSSSKGGA